MMKAKWIVLATLIAPSFGLGCGSPHSIALEVVGGVTVATVLGGRTSSNEIDQVFYLGIFDPQEQLPEAVYRITVRGQSSFISSMKFGSGWIPAIVADSLSSQISEPQNSDQVSITKGTESDLVSLKTGRRLMLFGPEGFREAPKDQRLAIVMGSSPEHFFQAIDQTLGQLAGQASQQGQSTLKSNLLKALSGLKTERDRLDGMKKDLTDEMRETKGNP